MASSLDGETVGPGDKEATLLSCVQELCAEHDLETAKVAVETMLRLANNVIQHPDDEKYKKLRTENKMFSAKVWRLPQAQQFMFVWGWTEVDDSIILLSDNDIQMVKQVLQRRLNLITSRQNSASTATSKGMTEKEKALHEERKRIQEQAKHEAEEKKRILAQIRADRQNLKDRQLKDSKARKLKSDGGMKKFEDIGVDLDGGGG